MFDVGSFRTKTCGTVGRRSFLRLAASVPIGIGLSQAVGQQVVRQGPRAKSVIFGFLWGAPSHLDTCDPKPDAPLEFRGPFHSIATRTPGLNFTELLPRMAARSDRFSIIRTHATSEPGHPDGGVIRAGKFLLGLGGSGSDPGQFIHAHDESTPTRRLGNISMASASARLCF